MGDSIDENYSGIVESTFGQSLAGMPDREARLAALPAYPETAAERAVTREHLARLTELGLTQAALPMLCQEAAYGLAELGPDHPDTLKAMYAVVGVCYQRGDIQPALYVWLIPRAARQWGVGHADTRSVVEQVATCLVLANSAALEHSTEVAMAAAQQLPGGLGWGSTVVAPVPDEAAYRSHVLLQAEAESLARRLSDVPRARAMLDRCVSYFGSLGPHWLATPRKAKCKLWLARCASKADGEAAAELSTTCVRFMLMYRARSARKSWVCTEQQASRRRVRCAC